MSTQTPNFYKLSDGINVYNPDIIADRLSFLELRNIDARLDRLFTSRGYSLFNDFGLASGDDIVGFGYYFLSNRQYCNVYAFTKTSIYWFDFESGAFDPTPIYTGFINTSDPYVVIPWFDCMYVTKFNAAFVKVERTICTAVANAPSGRYGILANSHVMLAGVSDNISTGLARIRWSDLDAPEDFVLNPDASEADFFDLEPSSLAITGVSYQRGNPIIYSQNDLWLGTYVGFPGSFRFEPLIPGQGNIFHDAVVHNKEVDYFIGQDNIYVLNGFQVSPIGDRIFERFINDVKITANTSVKGYLDTRKHQVFWVYVNKSDVPWSIVYNYKEDKWTERDPQDLTAWFDSPRLMFRGYQVIDDVSDIVDTDSDLIDDPNAGFPVEIPQLAGTKTDPTTPIVASASDGRLKINGESFESEMQTFDFFFDQIETTKQISKATIEYKGLGVPNITVSIGSRHNQNEDIVWSDPVAQVVQHGTMAFFFRTKGVGKYLRFKFEWQNTDSDYIDDLRFVALTKVENAPDIVEK